MDFSRLVRDHREAWTFFVLLYGSGQPLFYDAKRVGEGRQGAADAGGTGPKQLNIDHIASYSQQARGRMERVWHRLQKRPPPQLRLKGIKAIKTANRWLAEVYLPQHNARLAVLAAEEGTAFVPFVGDLGNILCILEERIAGQDNTVRYDGHVLQIPASRDRYHLAKATFRVLEYQDGRIALFHGPRRIARFLADGTLDEGEAVRKQSVT